MPLIYNKTIKGTLAPILISQPPPPPPPKKKRERNETGGKENYHTNEPTETKNTNHICFNFDVAGPCVADELPHRIPHRDQLRGDITEIFERHPAGDHTATEHSSIFEPRFSQSTSQAQHQVVDHRSDFHHYPTPPDGPADSN